MTNPFGAWQTYGKGWIAFLYAIAVVIIPLVSGDHHVDPAEGLIIALAVGNNLLVLIIPNKASFKGAKTLINAALAGVAVAQVVIVGGVSADDWLLIGAAVIGALGVAVAPSVSDATTAKPVVVSAGLTTG